MIKNLYFILLIFISCASQAQSLRDQFNESQRDENNKNLFIRDFSRFILNNRSTFVECKILDASAWNLESMANFGLVLTAAEIGYIREGNITSSMPYLRNPLRDSAYAVINHNDYANFFKYRKHEGRFLFSTSIGQYEINVNDGAARELSYVKLLNYPVVPANCVSAGRRAIDNF